MFTSEKEQSNITFAILIPFRDEAEHLPDLLKDLAALKYPKELFEIILIDDDSSDHSVSIIENFSKEHLNPPLRISVLKNEVRTQAPKKDAITLGVSKTTASWIVTTDADCRLPEFWLQKLSNLINGQQPKMVLGPVQFKASGTVVSNYQQLDGLSLQAITMASCGYQYPVLANGANLAYERDAFEQLDGYKGNTHIASGDDIFLLEKFRRKFPKQIIYLKSPKALINTSSKPNWRQVLEQRIRWASKTTKQKNSLVLFLGSLNVIFNLAYLFFLCLPLLWPTVWWYGGIFLLSKWIMDYMILKKAASCIGIKFRLMSYLPIALLHPLVNLWVLLNSLSGQYHWKGRTYKK